MHGFFLIVLIIIVSLTFIDFYFSISLSNFFKKRKYKKFIKWLPIYISIIMLLITIISFLTRNRDEAQTLSNKIIMYAVFFWYLPKLGIFPILLIKDIIKLCINFVKFIKLRVFKKPPFSKGVRGFSDDTLDVPPLSKGVRGVSDASEKKSALSKGVRGFSEDSHQELQSASRRRIAGNIAWSLAGVPFLIVGDNMLRNTYDFHIYPIQIPLTKLPPGLNGLKIVQISDIHAGSFLNKRTFMKACILANAVKPDLIFVTGDFVNNHPDEMVLAVEGLKTLNAQFGVYACLGNHDHYMTDNNHNKLINIIRHTGIDLIINENRKLTINGCKLQLAATDNTSWGDKFADFDKTLNGLNDIDPTILLCHDPNNWDKEINGKRNVDLMLAGHTHGGQFSCKIDGMEFSPVRYVYKYYAGLYKNKDQYLYVNRGCGTAGPPIRIGMKPEITVITLIKPENVA